MKRLLLLLALLMAAGCRSTPSIEQPQHSVAEEITVVSPGTHMDTIVSSPTVTLVPPPSRTATPAPTETMPPVTATPPAPSATPLPTPTLPLRYLVYDAADVGATEGDMFFYDFDQDGTEETISFKLNGKKGTTTIIVGNASITLKEGCVFLKAYLLDLDAASPRLNLLVVIDTGSDDYVTIELHLEDGKLKKGPKREADCWWEDDALWLFERTDILGTARGKRTYSGDRLTPDSDWLTMSYIPTAEDLETDRGALIESGTLLHVIRTLPCLIDGKEAKLPKGTYLYRLRYNQEGTQMVVCTLDGTEAMILLTSVNYEYAIRGKSVDYYFDNILFAD